MKRVSLWAGAVLVPIGWGAAAGGLGMIGHMVGHMIAVAIAAPLLAIGISGTRFDPVQRWPRAITPIGMMLVELCVVWAWHLPGLRAAADGSSAVLAIEQVCFLAAGLLLWSAVLGGGSADRRASGIAALLLTSMHMTLLGALIGLAPRPLYSAGAMHHGLGPLADQQLGGVVMLIVGAASYFIGGLAMLAGLLRTPREART